MNARVHRSKLRCCLAQSISWGVVAPALAFPACTAVGPQSISVDRFDDNSSIADSWKQQTLLNMIKLRYMDLPVFADVASIVAGYSLQTGVAVSAVTSDPGAVQGDDGSIGGNAVYADRPTLTYVPTTGEKFLRGPTRGPAYQKTEFVSAAANEQSKTGALTAGFGSTLEKAPMTRMTVGQACKLTVTNKTNEGLLHNSTNPLEVDRTKTLDLDLVSTWDSSLSCRQTSMKRFLSRTMSAST